MTENSTNSSQLDNRFEIPMTRWALWLAAFLVFLVVMSGRVRYTEGDSRFALVASMALLEHGSMRLDPYSNELDLAKLNNNHFWMVCNSGGNGHLYYDYPVGTPIFATPFVWIGRQLGMNPLQRDDDSMMQMAIAAILCSIIFLLLVRLSKLYLGDWAALLFSMAIFYGSTLISTMGTALWSQNFQTVFVLLVLLELAEFERGKRDRLRGIWIGGLLFAAYLCRPTSAALILPVFIFLAWRDLRRALPWAMGVSGGLFALFVLWSWLEMQMLLPRYYDPSLWQPGEGFWDHWLPLWFGPARGLWVFMPATLLVFAGWAFRKVRFTPLYLLFWVWLVLHTLLLARSQSPWGGWSFGPRFFTEIIPGLALVLLLLANELTGLQPRVRQALLGFFVAMSGFGVYVHTLQGLNNIETMAWNDNPNIDQHWKERRWDWRHPQFFASAHQRLDQIAERELKFKASQALNNLPKGANLLLGEPNPLARECFERWNSSNKFGVDKKLYNSIFALQNAGAHEFFFDRSMLKQVLTIPKVSIDSSVGYRRRFGEFLEVHNKFEIVVTGKDDCSTSLSPESRAYMNSIGSQLDSLKLRQSYVLHLYNGKVMYERFGNERIEYHLPNRPDVSLVSAGLFFGNTSSIVVDGLECSLNGRGMNVVVLDPNRKVYSSLNFDTHAEDLERVTMMKAKW